MSRKEISFEELKKYRPVAEYAKRIIMHELVNELKLQAPSRFLLASRNGMVWLIAVMNPLALGTRIKKYYDPEVAHQISTAFAGKPVYIANQTGLRYAVMLSQKPKLPKTILFPDFPEQRDLFLLGHTLKGEVTLSAAQMKNVLIGAAANGKPPSVERNLPVPDRLNANDKLGQLAHGRTAIISAPQSSCAAAASAGC